VEQGGVALVDQEKAPAGKHPVDQIREIERGTADRERNLLTGAPHTLAECTADEWDRPYSRERAAFPSEATRAHKVWPTVGRIDGAYGDRNLVCTWGRMEAYA
jgi:glycine dehydrogenase